MTVTRSVTRSATRSATYGATVGKWGNVSPITILGADLLAWWTADDAGSLTLSGATVTGWRDQKNGYVLAPGTSSTRPVYSPTSFGGAPGITFDGSDDYLNMAFTAQFPIGSAHSEIFCVASNSALAADTNTRCAVSYGNATISADRRVRRNVVAGVNRAQVLCGNGVTGLSTSNVAVDFSSRHLVTAVFDVASASIDVDLGGPLEVSVVPSTVAVNFAVGAAPNGAFQFWHGGIRDVIVASGLSPEKLAALNAWALPRRMV